MKTCLMALGWLRDLVLVLLVIAGNQIRQSSPIVGLLIMGAAAVIFAERFLWSWHLFDVADAKD